MAEEVKKIITVEVGKSITNVRDFKKHIEDLRGALLGLNQESDEYKAIAEQITTDQAKLNEVLSVGKKNTDSAAGSYNELNNQLKALRNQYRALSETERNSATGQAILQNITKLDEELKDIDESMGQYYRNVGNYKGAFEEAFKAMAQNIGNVNPELGKLMRTASSLIPLIKAASKAATTGLKGIKAGIASTGIGLLVVALGEIIANWEQIAKWAKNVLGIQEKITTETKRTKKEAEDYANTLGQALSKYERIMRSLGKTQEDIYNGQLNILNNDKSNISMFRGQAAALRQELNTIRQDYANAAKNRDNAKMEEQVKNLKNFADRYAAAAKIWGIEIKDVSYTISGWGGDFTRNMNNISQSLSDATKELKENSEKTDQAITDLNESYKEFANTENTNMKKRAENIGKTEEEIRKQQYEDEVAGAKKRLEARIISQKQYDEFVKNAEIILENDLKEIRNKASQSSPAVQKAEEDAKRAKDIFDSVKNFGRDELALLDEEYKEQKKLLEENGYDTVKLTEKYEADRQAIINQREQEITDRLNEENAKRAEDLRKSLDLDLSDQAFDEAQKVSGASRLWTRDSWTHEKDEKSEYQKQDLIYDIEMQGYQKRLELYDLYLSTMTESDEGYFDLKRERDTEEMAMLQAEYEHREELEDRLLDKRKKDMQIAQGMLSAYSGMWSAMVDSMLQGEEEGSEKWKAFKISEAVISTLAGMAGAFMQGMNSAPMPWGAIIGAAGATTAMITGMAQVNEIKNTQMGSGNGTVSGISAAGAGVGVEPLLNEQYDLQRMTNLSLQSDDYLPGNTQVYVLESDIQEVGTRVQVRENNATF